MLGPISLDTYNAILLALFLLLVVLGTILVRGFLARRKKRGSPLERTAGLFSTEERRLLSVLDQALGAGYRVFGKIRSEVLLRPKKHLKKRDRQQAIEVLAGQQFEFLVCREKDLEVIGVVGWEKESAKGKDARRAVLNEGLEEAGIPIVRFRPKSAFALEEVKAALRGTILPVTGGSPLPGKDSWHLGAPKQSVSQEEDWQLGESAPSPPSNAARKPPTMAASNNPSCPLCGSEMLRRRAASGPHAGTLFWTCSQFPRCRKVIPVKPMKRSGQG